MKTTQNRSSTVGNQLRARAERLLRSAPREVAQLPPEDVKQLVHELQVRQIELEMQNKELRRAQLELEKARGRYAELYDFAPAAYVTLSTKGEVLEANLRAARLLGVERDRLIHQKFTSFLQAASQDAFYCLCRQVFNSDAKQSVQLELLGPNSQPLVIHLEAIRDAASDRKQCRVSFTDITEHKRAEEQIAQLSRVQTILAEIDRAIIHIPDRQKLLDEVCRVAVEKGGFRLAWVGMASPDGVVQPVAKAGAIESLKGIRVVTHDVPNGRGPVGTAIRENRPVVVENISQDARMAPWRSRALKFGMHYVAAFPLRIADKVIGAFQVYAPRANSFDETELNLLNQVSGEISFALTAISELTARRQAEAALAESNRFNQQIITSAKDGIIVYSRNLKYVVWNPFMEELTGVPAAEILGKRPLEIFPFLRDKGVIQRLKKVLAGETDTPSDFPFVVHQTGRSGWVSDTNSALRNATGEIIGVIGIVRDITGRVQAEQSLRRSEQNLTVFFNHSPIGLQWLSAGGNVLRANQAQLDLLGCSAEEYIGHFYGEFLTDPASAHQLLERLAVNEMVSNLRMTLRRKDGVSRLMLVDAQPLWHEGQFLYSSIFSRDITDRVNLEREILEIGERERRRIARDLHDDLGQLLVGTAFLANSLRHDLAAKSIPEARQLDRLLSVLDEAIRGARSLAHGLHPVKAEPDGLMAALGDLASRTKAFFDIGCRFTCRQPVLIEDSTTATHLYRIAQEAVTNAIKHGKPSRIEIGLTRTPSRITLAVKDNGVGLSAKPRKKPGMGLRIMRYRAGVIGGSLAIQKTTGQGTTVVCSVHEFAPVLGSHPESATEKEY